MIRRQGVGWVGVLTLLLGGAGAVGAQDHPLDALHWMSGCWIDQRGGGWSEEVWTSPAEGLLLGVSRSVSESGRVAFEYLRVEATGEGVSLYASPGGASATAFPAVAVGPQRFRVERPDHDFPRAIEYRPAGRDSLVAHVFGEVDGDAPAFSLHFARAPCPGGGG